MTNFIFMNKNKFLTMASALVAVACNTAIETPVQYGELSVSLAGEPQVDHLISLSLGYLICKMGIIPT